MTYQSNKSKQIARLTIMPCSAQYRSAHYHLPPQPLFSIAKIVGLGPICVWAWEPAVQLPSHDTPSAQHDTAKYV